MSGDLRRVRTLASQIAARADRVAISTVDQHLLGLPPDTQIF
jgi:hypothetical protein